jgi:hypothetical protein
MAVALDTAHMSDAYRALRSDQGRRAVAGGWPIQLWEFVLEHGRIPGSLEERELLERAAEIAKTKFGWLECAQRAHDIRLQKFARVANGIG